MKKKNNGFMLLETLVVASFIIGTLIFLYVQFANLKKNYDYSFKYDTIPGLYSTKNIDLMIKNNYNYSQILGESERATNAYVTLYDGKDKCNSNFFSKNLDLCNSLMEKQNVSKAIMVSNNVNKFKDHLKTNKDFSSDFYLFTKKIKQKDEGVYLLIVEFNDKTYASLNIIKSGL